MGFQVFAKGLANIIFNLVDIGTQKGMEHERYGFRIGVMTMLAEGLFISLNFRSQLF